MRYMLLIYDDEQAWGRLSEGERQQIMAEYGKFTQQVRSTGHYGSGAQLFPAVSAVQVRVREGKRLRTDGPFAETREQLGGYYLIEARDLDEATAIAARIPSARVGTVEVRPVGDVPEPAVVPGGGAAPGEGSMKYMMLIHHDEGAWDRMTDADRQPALTEFRRLRQELLSSHQYLDGAPLHPTSSATSVRVRNDRRLLTDGPFAETREQLGGYFLVAAKDLDDAIRIAAGIPAARWGTIEIRQVVEATVPAPATA